MMQVFTPVKERRRVLLPYTADNEDELTLAEGDIVTLVSLEGPNWWLGELRGRVGLFPNNFVSPVPYTVMERRRVLFPYTAINEEELTLAEDDIVTLVSQEGPDWWRGELRGRVGLFPDYFVSPVPYTGEERRRVLFPYTANNEDELTLAEGDIVTLVTQESPDWWRGELRGRVGLFPDYFLSPIPFTGADRTPKTVHLQRNDSHAIAPENVIRPKRKTGPDDVVYLVDEDDSEISPVLAFSNEQIRKGFIRKVYAILLVQLAVTIGFMAQCMYHEQTRLFVRHNRPCLYFALFVMFAITIALVLSSDLRRKAPLNIIVLAIYTLAVSYMLGVVAAVSHHDEVLLAVGITAAVVIALTIFAFQTKYDFTTMGGMLLSFLIALLMFGILCYFWRTNVLRLVYSSIAVVVFSFYIVYDTQLMLGGKHKYAISPEDYIFAALSLYIDIINLLLHILRLVKS